MDRDGDRAQRQRHRALAARGVSLSHLVLSIADNKQMLGLRYAEWATRAPSLEADIAAAAMGLDDLGHSRVLYGCLEPLGEDPRSPERETDPGSLRSLPYFDEPWTESSQFVAAAEREPSTRAPSPCFAVLRRKNLPQRLKRKKPDPRSEPRCTHCGAHDAEVISLFGTQAMTLQYKCRRCGTLFEAIKYG